MKENNEIKIGAVLSYLQMTLNIIVGLSYTPLMVRLLGKSEYGLYSTAASVISMLSILSLGFGSSYIKYYARYKTENDKESIYKLNGMFLLIFSIVGIVSMLCGLVITGNLELVFKNGLTQEEYKIARVLMLLLTINLSVNFPMSVFGTIINANQRFIFLKIVNMIKTVVSPLVTLPLLLAGYRSIAMVSVTLVMALLADALNVYYVFFVLKDRFVFHSFEKGLFRSMSVFTFFIMINTIVRQINWNVDKVFLGRFQGTGEVAVYAVASSLHVYYENFSTAVSNVFRPKVHLMVNAYKDDKNQMGRKLTTLMIQVGRIQFIILGLIATGLIFFGYSFIVDYWVGTGYESAYAVLLLLILPTSIFLIQNIGVDVQRAMNKHQFRSIAYVIMSIVNVIMTIILCQIYGAVGAAIGTAVSVFAIDGVVMNIFYHRACGLNMLEFWKSIAKLSKGLIIPIGVGIVMNRVLDMQSVVQYLIGIVFYSVVYIASMWYFGMNMEEKSLLKNSIRRLHLSVKRRAR